MGWPISESVLNDAGRVERGLRVSRLSNSRTDSGLGHSEPSSRIRLPLLSGATKPSGATKRETSLYGISACVCRQILPIVGQKQLRRRQKLHHFCFVKQRNSMNMPENRRSGNMAQPLLEACSIAVRLRSIGFLESGECDELLRGRWVSLLCRSNPATRESV